jgi:hypothetical protein
MGRYAHLLIINENDLKVFDNMDEAYFDIASNA